jgi:predicted nucleic acid-binding protein
VSLVIDSSLTLAWYFPDEASKETDQLLRRVAVEGAVVPDLWRAEVANGFQSAIRRRRIDANYRDSSLVELAKLPIAVDPDTNAHVWGATVRLADLHRLTIYDAIYLELAQRRRLPLATLDVALATAARGVAVEVLGMARP